MTSRISDIAQEVDFAFLAVGIACVLLLIGVTVAMIVIVTKYRRSRVKKVQQVDGNLKLEITWIILPTILVMWMFYVALDGFYMMRNPKEGAMEVNVTGRQWAWEFAYPDSGVTSQEMYVPVNTPVKVNLTAPPGDVIHSFFLPDFRVKEDVVPGKKAYIWFEAKEKGTYNIFCAEFCGKDHSAMLSLLHVVSDEEYRDWTAKQLAKRYKPLVFEGIKDPNYKAFGKDDLNIDSNLLFRTYCVSCHGEAGDGSGLPGTARDFTHTADWKNGTKVTEIFKTLEEGIPDTQMRAFPNFTPWERVALAHRVRAFLKDKAEADTQADYDKMVETYSLDKIKGPTQTIPVDRAMELIVDEAKGEQK